MIIIGNPAESKLQLQFEDSFSWSQREDRGEEMLPVRPAVEKEFAFAELDGPP
jgi:hypothetical protein